jgi:hypothetical protein
MGYRWKHNLKGQYVDGHERQDVVDYHQNIFLPAIMEFEGRMRRWTEDHGWDLLPLVTCATALWYHDEMSFQVHDQHQTAWYHNSTTPVPYAKGEGASIMIADFISADYSWLQSPDGQESAQVMFQAGKAHEGYFTNDNIVAQVEHAMEILAKYYPNEDHVFVYDCASTHLKRSEEALSASKMPKNPSKPDTNFGVVTNVLGENGKPVYGRDGKILKQKIRMRNLGSEMVPSKNSTILMVTQWLVFSKEWPRYSPNAGTTYQRKRHSAGKVFLIVQTRLQIVAVDNCSTTSWISWQRNHCCRHTARAVDSEFCFFQSSTVS